MNNRPITEDDLQAYIDNALNSARRDEVAEYLEQQPDVARRIESYGKQRDVLRTALAPITDEPVPPELNLALMIESRQKYRFPLWRAAAASVVVLGLGGIAGWSLHNLFPPASGGIVALADEAAYTYQVYASDKGRPVEIKASDQADLVKWVSNRLRHTVSVPDLSASGYRFMGGRLVATAHGPAAMFMYDDDRGTRLVMLTRPMAIDQNSPMSQHSTGPVQGVTWSKEGNGYSLVGPVSSETLTPLAEEMRKQIEQEV
jgi:anti-sigma factor RsiW